MKLNRITLIEATLELKTGLHIGAGDTEMHIGGIDNPVIKNPITNLPYIPGSSIKGKMRSLLEWRSGAVKSEPLSLKDKDKKGVLPILQLFGISGDAQLTNEQAMEIGPTRLAFWDCELDPEWEKNIQDDNMLLTEVKSENSIDRISCTALNPRFTERVPAGARFRFRLSFKQLEQDDPGLLDTVLEGMKLLEYDSLGGSGSRGYGKIAFTDITINGEDAGERFGKTQPFATN